MISVRPGRTSHSPRSSISAFIPTPSFQFDGSPKGGPSPTSPGSRSLIHKRSRSRSSDGSSHFSAPSDKTHYDQESEGESPAVPAPPQKRRREEKKHQCPYCKKLFHRPVSLGVHINTHTGDKRTSAAAPPSSNPNSLRSNPAYTCPFPNCSRQFNVNSNMRRHYRTHFTPGAFDLTELSYSTADERFYPMAVNNTSPANSTNAAGHHTRGRCNTGPFIPPVPSAYGSSFSPPTSQSYPPLRIPPNSESRSNRPAPYVVPITVYHNPRSQPDRLASPPLRSRDHRSSNAFGADRSQGMVTDPARPAA